MATPQGVKDYSVMVRESHTIGRYGGKCPSTHTHTNTHTLFMS